MSSHTSINSVYAAFDSSLARWPERPLLNVLPETATLYDVQPGEISYNDAAAKINEIANMFQQAGLRAGERVLLLLENRPDFFLHWLAMNKIGVSVVPLNPDLRAAELEYLIGHAEPAFAIALPDYIDIIRTAAASAHSELLVIEPGANITAAHKPRPVARQHKNVADREAAVLYTSGTTGKPKGCVLSNDYFLMAGQWYASTGGLCTLSIDGERMITPLPVFHMNAMAYSFMAMLTVGGCLTCLDRFHPRSWWHSVRTANASCLHYLGVMPSLLMAAEPRSDDRTHKVRFGFGAGIDSSLHASFEERFGFPLVEAWAMTETGAGAVIAANQEPRCVGESVIGRPGETLLIKLVDDENKPVPMGTPGELLVRHAGSDPRRGFFSEYYKDPQATENAWLEGWFHTGDLVKQNTDGNMVFVDRKKNVIRRSGENISAVEVESVLMQHPNIIAAGVTAVPDSLRGDEVFACLQVTEIAPRQDHGHGQWDTPDRAQQLATNIVKWCLTQLAYFKAPAYIAFVDALPLTSTQKIQRGELKEIANSLLTDPETVCTGALKKRQLS